METILTLTQFFYYSSISCALWTRISYSSQPKDHFRRMFDPNSKPSASFRSATLKLLGPVENTFWAMALRQ